MRKLAALLLAALIVIPIQASASSDTLWDDARVVDGKGVFAGTIGGVSIVLTNDTTKTSASTRISELPSIVEVYTATWCTNCVKTEQALDEALGDQDVTRIHYHRHLFETRDPFGSNSTDSRWVDSYGMGSIESSETDYLEGQERVAPSKVFDGERMYTGISTKSNSLATDYSTALALGSSHPFYENGSMSLSVERQDDSRKLSFSWENIISSNIENWEVAGWLMFVENSANFPDGSNGKENYSHILHEAVNIGESKIGSIVLEPPRTWDGDDMSVVLVIDWLTTSNGDSLPAPAVSTLLCMLAALVPRRQRQSLA
ncbi:MAG: hypothetical protein CMB67_02785 [Euryarchaeota archaeon]|nr:hypothetical protein [Euryarchaeota archaeon]